jgi:hypothetical protein
MENLKSTIARIKAKGLKWHLYGGLTIRYQGMCPLSCLVDNTAGWWSFVEDVPVPIRNAIMLASDAAYINDQSHKSNIIALRAILLKELGIGTDNTAKTG